MSDIRKWLKIIENVQPALADQQPKSVLIKKDATVMVDPRVGGGTARYMHSTPQGAMVDIKGVPKELKHNDFSLPERDYQDPYESSNTWFHKSQDPDTIGTMNDKPEFRSGDMVKVADVYGTTIGAGYGVFVAYSTSGKDCIISFDSKQIVVPVENVGSVLEQNAKDNFSQTDNDGNLSPMSLGCNNVKIEKEPAMDQRDEFSKWMRSVEEAISGESTELAKDIPHSNECGCGSWECASCFPEQDGIDDRNQEAALVIGGVEIQEPTTQSINVHSGHDDTQMDMDLEMGMDDIAADEFNDGLEEVSMFDEEEQDFQQDPVEKSRSGKGVKLGDIVTKTEFRKTGGQDSPLTYGDENLDEEDPQGMQVQQPVFGEEQGSDDTDDGMDMISVIKYMQNVGLSNADKSFSDEEMATMPIDQLKKVHSMVTGEVAEAAGPKPTKTKSYNHLDDLEDVLNPRQADLPTTFGNDDNDIQGAADDQPMHLPAASRDATQNKLRGMTPSDTMRDYMNRINPTVGSAEPAIPDIPENELVVRTAQDVPAVINSAMQASGMQMPEWHSISNLPGFRDRNIRGMGRQVFGMFTSTPVEQIQTMANVGGQGPSTDAEMRAVAGWLRDNAEDLGVVDVGFGAAIPGYHPDVKEYKINGVRFHVVRDPMGQYIYAYPDQDARLHSNKDPAQGNQLPGGKMPKLRESKELLKIKPTLFEQMRWDEEIRDILKENEIDEDEIEESTLSKKIGKLPDGKRNQGGQNLVKLLHANHKLGNESDLQQIPFNKNVLWTEFKTNPDNFVIVQGSDGVAGIKPSQEYINFMKEKYTKANKTYNPAGDSNLKYQVIAFRNDGAKLDSSLFQAPGKEKPESKAKKDGEEFTSIDPTVIRTRMGMAHGKDTQVPHNVFNLLSEEIGTLKYVWVSGFWGLRGEKGQPQDIGPNVGSVEREKMAKRSELTKGPEVSEMGQITKIFKRIRPVLKTLGNQALSQINNRAKRYIDGGNFEAATEIAKSGNKLKQFLATIDTSGDVNLSDEYFGSTYSFTNHIKKAIADASGSRPGQDEYNDFLKRAASGGSTELKPILDSLRDNLVSLR